MSAYHPERNDSRTKRIIVSTPGFVRQIFHFPQFATSLNSPRHDWLRIGAWNFPAEAFLLYIRRTNTYTHKCLYTRVRYRMVSVWGTLEYSNKLIGRCYRRFTLMLCLLNGSGFEHQTKLPPLA